MFAEILCSLNSYSINLLDTGFALNVYLARSLINLLLVVI